MTRKFMISFDVESSFTNIALKEGIDIAVKYISEANPDLKLSTTEHRHLRHFATAQNSFLLKVHCMIQPIIFSLSKYS